MTIIQGNIRKLEKELNILKKLYYNAQEINEAAAYLANLQKMEAFYESAAGYAYFDLDLIVESDMFKLTEIETLNEYEEEIAIERHKPTAVSLLPALKKILKEITPVIMEIQSNWKKDPIVQYSDEEVLEIMRHYYKQRKNNTALEVLEQVQKENKIYSSQSISFGNVPLVSHFVQTPNISINGSQDGVVKLCDFGHDMGCLTDYYSFIKENSYLSLFHYTQSEIYQEVIPKYDKKDLLFFLIDQEINKKEALNYLQTLCIDSYYNLIETYVRTNLPNEMLFRLTDGTLTDKDMKEIEQMVEEDQTGVTFAGEDFTDVDFFQSLNVTTGELFSNTMIMNDRNKIRTAEDSKMIFNQQKYASHFEDMKTELGFDENDTIKILTLGLTKTFPVKTIEK